MEGPPAQRHSAAQRLFPCLFLPYILPPALRHHSTMASTYLDDEERVLTALEVAQLREKPNIAAIAKEYKVAVGRLRRRYRGTPSRAERPPSNRKLDYEQEAALIEYCNRVDVLGTSARLHMVESCANQLLAQCHDDPLSRPPTVGPQWVKRFKDRHPELQKVKQKGTELERMAAHDREAFQRYFDRFKQVVEEKGILVSRPPVSS